MRRPAKIRVLLALLGATALLGSGIASAQESGGVGVTPPSDGSGTTEANGDFKKVPFGSRVLSKGMAGNDVKTLNWVLNAVSGPGPRTAYFKDPTDSLVRRFQNQAGLNVDGVVRRPTRKRIAARMKNQLATWYGPGFWGNRTACGQRLKRGMIGVAHKRLPCGTKLVFAHQGRWIRTKVIDRGPYNGNYRWDLTRRAAKRLGFLKVGAGKVKVAVVGR